MEQTTDFAKLLNRYFNVHLTNRRGASPKTMDTYRQAFTQLLSYAQDKLGIRPTVFAMKDFTFDIVNNYLDWLEKEKKSSISTRNLRLAVMRSFASFAMIERPDCLEECQKISSIRQKKHPEGEMVYLKAEGMKLLLEQPDTRTDKGKRDHLIIALFYATGMRVSEIIGLKPSDISFSEPKTIRIFGKGSKIRYVPLVKQIEKPLREYMESKHMFSPDQLDTPLFRNHSGAAITRQGLFLIIRGYAKQARELHPELIPEGVGCHTLRHSTAMELVNSGVDLIYIRDLLGHSSVQTTEIYARADTDARRMAIESSAKALVPEEDAKWETDESVMAWLESITGGNIM